MVTIKTVLQEERDALLTWLQVKRLPTDVREGMEISLDKIERVLGIN